MRNVKGGSPEPVFEAGCGSAGPYSIQCSDASGPLGILRNFPSCDDALSKCYCQWPSASDYICGY
jgi:hypothetical protein